MHGVHDLPGLPLEAPDPHAPASEVMADYFARYEQRFALPVRRPVTVDAVREAGVGRSLVSTDAGSWTARALINATGTWTRPFWPAYPGMAAFRGRQLHTADYRSAGEFAGKHVVVVGGGHSAIQLLAEISAVTTTTWVTRRPPAWRDTPFDQQAGREAVAMVEQAVTQGRRSPSVVSDRSGRHAAGRGCAPPRRPGVPAGV